MNGLNVLNNALGMAVVIAIFGLIGENCRRDIRQLVSARNVFLMTILAWYGLEAIIVPEDLMIYSQGEYHYGLFCVVLSVVGFLVGYGSSRGGVFDPAFKRLASIDRPGLIWSVFLFALALGFLPLIVLSKGDLWLIVEDAFVPKARWSGPFQRGRYGGLRDAFLELQMFQRAALPFAAAVVCFPKQRSDRRLVASGFLIYMVARALNDGTRGKVLEALLPIAAALYWRMKPAMKRQALVFGLPALAVLGFLWSAAAVLGRNEGLFDWEKAVSADYVGFEMFRELLWLQKAVPEHASLQWGHTYYVQLVNPIPRAIWPGKPTGDAGLLMAEIRESVQHGADLTISPGMIGEMYWNFHVPGILMLSAVCGYLAKSWDRVRPTAAKSLLAFTVFAAGLSVIFLSGRSFNMSAIYGLIALYVVLVLFGRRKSTLKPVANGSRLTAEPIEHFGGSLRNPESRKP